jgi:hypothetical protein
MDIPINTNYFLNGYTNQYQLFFCFSVFLHKARFVFFTFSLVWVRFGLWVEDEIFEQGSNIVIESDQGSNFMSLL